MIMEASWWPMVTEHAVCGIGKRGVRMRISYFSEFASMYVRWTWDVWLNSKYELWGEFLLVQIKQQF